MKILALEFSSSLRSVAVVERSADGEIHLCSNVAETDFRGSSGMALIDRALSESSLLPSAIEVIAVGLGPGSYAGIRSAIAISQGWSLARNTPLVGISSVEALACEAQQQGKLGRVKIVVDAQRKELYEATFLIAEGEIRVLAPLRIVPIAAGRSEDPVVGPAASKVLPGALDIFPTATAVARLAAGRSTAAYVSGENLEPIYLRETSFVKAPVARSPGA